VLLQPLLLRVLQPRPQMHLGQDWLCAGRVMRSGGPAVHQAQCQEQQPLLEEQVTLPGSSKHSSSSSRQLVSSLVRHAGPPGHATARPLLRAAGP